MKDLPYRQGIIAIIIDPDDKFLILNLSSYDKHQWNFLGGGQDSGETFEDTLWREINEEIGMNKDSFEMLNKSENKLSWDYPPEVLKVNIKKGKYYKGQEKEPYLLRFTGDKKDIKICFSRREGRMDSIFMKNGILASAHKCAIDIKSFCAVLFC